MSKRGSDASLGGRKQLTANSEARDELLAAALWYDEQREGLGLELLKAVRESLDQLVESPQIGSAVPGTPTELQCRQVQVQRFPYAIVYIALDDELRVLRSRMAVDDPDTGDSASRSA